MSMSSLSAAVPLTIAAIERLAKAGVPIQAIAVVPLPETQTTAEPWPRSLSEAFWQRWRRSHASDMMVDTIPEYGVSVHEHADIAYVFVQPQRSAPFILEDNRKLFPSDALMAKLALWEQTGESTR